jgi:hypothetical protein
MRRAVRIPCEVETAGIEPALCSRRTLSAPRTRRLAGSEASSASDCKAVYTGSIPVVAFLSLAGKRLCYEPYVSPLCPKNPIGTKASGRQHRRAGSRLALPVATRIHSTGLGVGVGHMPPDRNVGLSRPGAPRLAGDSESHAGRSLSRDSGGVLACAEAGDRFGGQRCSVSWHENASWRLCPVPAVGSGDPAQGLCWENVDG